jgi:succinoglycan biosynthesis transport protein ExoP
LIEPPVTPEEPSKPNRLAIGILGFLFASGGGFGSGALAESLVDRMSGRYGIVRMLGVPPLAVIPLMDTASSVRNRLQNRFYVLLAVLIVIAAIAIAVNFAYKPLDVLAFQILRVLHL